MTFSWFRMLPIVAMSIFPAMSYAQSLCDPGALEQEMQLRHALPEKCKKERIQASGDMSFGIIPGRGAEAQANKAWRREAVTKFGEQWAETKFMACRRVLCVRGSIAGSQRCTISGFPCSADMNQQDIDQVRSLDQTVSVTPPYGPAAGESEDLRSAYGYHRPAEVGDLDQEGIKHLQEMLGVTPDGDFGAESYRALRDFRRTAGLRMEGPPNREDLERLAKTERRGYGR